ncbi:Intracellular distribution of mitochondria [Taxawa tesnikishii (nom. ined.)]|nr:Intracellular distribution of mitochondria [Dothideales sp. JES 119]
MAATTNHDAQGSSESTPTSNEAASESHATANGSMTNGDETDKTADGDAADTQAPENGLIYTQLLINATDVFQLKIKLPHAPGRPRSWWYVGLACLSEARSTQEQVQDIRQSIIDLPFTFQYSCFHLEHKGKRINDFVELSEVPDITSDPVATLVEDPYTETQSRMHFVRVRELVGASGDRTDLLHGIQAGLSLHDNVSELPPNAEGKEQDTSPEKHAMVDYDLDAPGSVKTLLAPAQEPAPKTGHLLYILVTTNEGEQYHVTSHVSGFFVNKSTNNKFDPFPRSSPKSHQAHSLLNLISQISPSFESNFKALQEYNGKKDPLAAYQLANAIPASPWVVSSESASLSSHVPDVARSQESYLLSGPENAETLRDWNEEFQSTRELPKENVQDRVFRERLTSKLFAEYNEAAVRGAVLVARGEVAPLNPTEARDAQIFVYNNVFYSFGADGVGTFASDGGDEAARVATGKDVMGVKAVNQLDINGLFTPGTVVVDYLGKRLVGQSIVPGIFKQREPGEHQIDYGGVEGKDIIAEHEAFKQPFAELSKAMRVKKHAVWDKENQRHDLEGSVETKGLLGTDGRKYVLDLYRITPLDVAWLEQHRKEPRQMELVESYWRLKLREYVQAEVTKRQKAKKDTEANAGAEQSNESAPEDALAKATNGEVTAENKGSSEGPADKKEEQERVDVSGFQFTLNPDVYCGQRPQTDEEKEEWAKDEAEVRAACKYLTGEVIPKMLQDLQEGDVGFPMDGQSLASLLHKRGVNMRYLGEIARLADKEDLRLQALKQLAMQEMISRGFKHPTPESDEALKPLYPEEDFAFEKVTPEGLKSDIVKQIYIRYRYDMKDSWIQEGKQLQLLREVCVKLGFQLEAKEYAFTKDSPALETKASSDSLKASATNGQSTGGKKKKRSGDQSPSRAATQAPPKQTFHPDNILNIIPTVKEASPRSVLAEEALEAGRISIAQDQKELGQELLLESLPSRANLRHPAPRGCQSSAAVELARKAVIISERTLGVDHAETVLSYLNLSLFEHASGNTKNALAYVRHALDLWKLVYGIKHPDSITTINNAAVMLQALKQYHESRIWFEASLAVCEEVSGKNSINTATLLFQLAQALALDRDAKGAVNRMRESYNIFKKELGPEDRNTKEAEAWLDSLTQSAVSIAKHAKDIQTRKLMMRPRAPRVAQMGARPQPQVGQSAAEAVQPRSGREGLDTRSVDELLKYINGESGNKTPKKKQTNPKRRQQRAQ